MPKRSSYAIKEKILSAVREKPATYAELERKVNTGYRTIKANCEELAKFSLIKIQSCKDHQANGRSYHLVCITEKGLVLL